MGHLFGDYLFQTNKMAFFKKKKIEYLLLHCWIYSISVLIFVSPYYKSHNGLIFLFLIFISHAILDGTNFIEWYLSKIKSRSWKTIKDNPLNLEKYHTEINISFVSLVQTIADNTIHLFLMYLIFKYSYLFF